MLIFHQIPCTHRQAIINTFTNVEVSMTKRIQPDKWLKYPNFKTEI